MIRKVLPVLLSAFAAMLLLCLTGCGGSSSIAATVDDRKISEAEITESIQAFRIANGLEDEETWARYLIKKDSTPAAYRQLKIDNAIELIIIEDLANKRGISVTEEELDQQVAVAKDYYGDEYEAVLEKSLYTEESYREYIREVLLRDHLRASYANSDIADSLVLKTISDAAASKAIHDYMVIILEDEATASSVKSQALSGVDFASLQGRYTSTPANPYDGWSTVDKYENTLAKDASAMSLGDVIGPYRLNDGTYVVVKCINEVSRPDGGFSSLSDIPQEYVSLIRKTLADSASYDAYESAIATEKQRRNITINDMPKGLPYAVDLMEYEPDNSNVESIVIGQESSSGQ